MKTLSLLFFLFSANFINAQRIVAPADFPKNPKPGKCYEKKWNKNETYGWKPVECLKTKSKKRVDFKLTEEEIRKARAFSNTIKIYQKELLKFGYKVDINGNLDKKTVDAHHKFLIFKKKEKKRLLKIQKKKLRQEKKRNRKNSKS